MTELKLPFGSKGGANDINETGAIVLATSFVAQPGGPPFLYNVSFDASAGNGFTADHYKLEVQLREGLLPTDQKVIFSDTLIIDGGATSPKDFRIFSDAAYSVPATAFGPSDTIYLEVYAGGAASNVTSRAPSAPGRPWRRCAAGSSPIPRCAWA